MQLTIKSWGDDSCPALVMLHGWGMHAAVWETFAKALATHFYVLCVDLPGHGQSGDIQVQTLAQVVDMIAEQLPEGKMHVLGWSYGGLVAVEYAQHYPDRCASLFLLGFNPCFVRTTDWPGADLKTLQSFEKSLQKNVAITLKRFAALLCLSGQDEKQMASQLWQLLNLQEMPAAESLHRHLMLLMESDVRSTLQNLGMPVSLMFFEKDQLVPVQCADYAHELYPRFNVHLLENASHFPFFTHQQDIIQIIRESVVNG